MWPLLFKNPYIQHITQQLKQNFLKKLKNSKSYHRNIAVSILDTPNFSISVPSSQMEKVLLPTPPDWSQVLSPAGPTGIN